MEAPKKAAIFYGSRKPIYEIKTEAPLHIAAAHLAAMGANNRRIARALGRSEVWMCNLTRQPFFQERVLAILKDKNRDGLESMFKMQRLSDLKKPCLFKKGSPRRTAEPVAGS